MRHATLRLLERRRRFESDVREMNGNVQLAPPHDSMDGYLVRLTDLFGTTSRPFVEQATGRLASVMRGKSAKVPTSSELNAGLAAIDGIQPRDEVEAMLAIQMVATYEVAMEMLTRAKHADMRSTLKESGALAVKLLRAYTAQVDSLARLRRGGEQRVTVEHVHVHEGGQAIVGTVKHGQGGG